MTNGKRIYIGGGTIDGHSWGLRFVISAKEHICESHFVLRSESNKIKKIYIANGTEGRLVWQLSINVMPKKLNWEGVFYVHERRKNKGRTTYLTGGSENGWGWMLNINVSEKKCKWIGSFHLANETVKYRGQIRAKDRAWASRKFPRQWLQQFEVHHSWGVAGEVCYFLTPKEHIARDRQIRYGASATVPLGGDSATGGPKLNFAETRT